MMTLGTVPAQTLQTGKVHIHRADTTNRTGVRLQNRSRCNQAKARSKQDRIGASHKADHTNRLTQERHKADKNNRTDAKLQSRCCKLAQTGKARSKQDKQGEGQ